MEKLYTNNRTQGHLFKNGLLPVFHGNGILTKTESGNDDVFEIQIVSVSRGTYVIDLEGVMPIDSNRKCGTCKSDLMIGFDFCVECGDMQNTKK